MNIFEGFNQIVQLYYKSHAKPFLPTENRCDENAEGYEINGVIECFCKRGFYGNGENCTGMF